MYHMTQFRDLSVAEELQTLVYNAFSSGYRRRLSLIQRLDLLIH